MKTNFLPQFQYESTSGGGGLDIAGIGSIVQGVSGLAQTIGGWIQQRKATKWLEKNPYVQNKGILDYYNQALQRYGVSPTDSAMYKRQTRDIDRGVATGLNALQDRRSGIAGASSLLRNANDARLNANVAAEQQQNQRFGVLGNATNMKANEDRYKFDTEYNLKAAKAAAGAQIMNSGISNIFGAVQGAAQMGMMKDLYGTGGKSTVPTTPATSIPMRGMSTNWLMQRKFGKL